jgi:hypothetical protein
MTPNISRVTFESFSKVLYRDNSSPFATSLGLPADAQAVMVFAGYLDKLP